MLDESYIRGQHALLKQLLASGQTLGTAAKIYKCLGLIVLMRFYEFPCHFAFVSFV